LRYWGRSRLFVIQEEFFQSNKIQNNQIFSTFIKSNFMIKNSNSYYFLLIGLLFQSFFYGCGGLQESAEKSSKIGHFIQKSCNCDDINMETINELGQISINLKLIGCQFNSIESLSDSLIIGLQNDIPNFCSPKERINFIFINKREASVVSYVDCHKVEN
jgi:hypothetical protein